MQVRRIPYSARELWLDLILAQKSLIAEQIWEAFSLDPALVGV
jgi:hypothetical protein